MGQNKWDVKQKDDKSMNSKVERCINLYEQCS
ncbi:conserved hypothetical protein [Vibrio cholerae O395]|nr:conserved hypothetical protein [Vibrio cholerae O395]